MANKAEKKQGFTLVELAISLVIIGLLTGGILVGKNMIRNSEVQNIVKQKETLVSAILTFQEKYNALPGDFVDATRIWGAAAAPASCATTVGSGNQTCSGNGNGKIASSTKASENHERHRAWQQLAIAGLIEGTYTGVAGSNGGWHAVPGENCPEGKIAGSCWAVAFLEADDPTNWLFNGVYNHSMYFGRESADSSPNNFVVTPEEAWGIDSKFDDGLPARGTIVTTRALFNCHGATTPAELDVTYKINNDKEACCFVFRNLFH